VITRQNASEVPAEIEWDKILFFAQTGQIVSLRTLSYFIIGAFSRKLDEMHCQFVGYFHRKEVLCVETETPSQCKHLLPTIDCFFSNLDTLGKRVLIRIHSLAHALRNTRDRVAV